MNEAFMLKAQYLKGAGGNNELLKLLRVTPRAPFPHGNKVNLFIYPPAAAAVVLLKRLFCVLYMKAPLGGGGAGGGVRQILAYDRASACDRVM